MMLLAAQAQQQLNQSDDLENENNHGSSPLQIISDIEPVADSTVSHMQELAQLRDN